MVEMLWICAEGRIGGIWVNQTKDNENGARPQRRFMDVVKVDMMVGDRSGQWDGSNWAAVVQAPKGNSKEEEF